MSAALREGDAARSPRLVGADLLRAVATIGVIAIHASHWPFADSGAAKAVWTHVDEIGRFAVPAFLMLTGVVLTYAGGARRPGPGWMRRRLSRSLIPWFAWMPVYALTGWFFTNDITHTLGGLANWVVGGGGHLYYLIIVPQFYVLWLYWPRARRWVWPLAAGLLSVQLLLDCYRLFEPFPGGPVEHFLLWSGYLTFPFWLGYFALGVGLGHVLREGGEDHPRLALAALVTVPFAAWLLVLGERIPTPHPDFATGSGAFLLPLLPPLVVSVVLACLFGGSRLLGRRPWLARPVQLVATYSLGIYILHPLLLYAPGRLLFTRLEQPLPDAILPYLALVFTTLLLTLAVVRLLVTTPLARTLGSGRQPLPRPRLHRTRAAEAAAGRNGF
ncbi:MAG: acyltransferase [Candidatus Dormibacteria bacterium]